jgi:hypothetical protein
MLLTELSVFKMSIHTFLEEFWTKFQNLMKGLGIENKITLNHIVLGYKIDDKNYLALNFLIFSIWKVKLYLV